MNEPHPVSPRVRLQALLAVPDRQRTDEQWDEINELEILLAPGNRERGPEQNNPRQANPPGGRPKPGGGTPPQHGKKQGRKFHKRPSKGKGP